MVTKEMTIYELSKLAGVTVEALYDFNKMGLLKPNSKSQSREFLYSENNFFTLQQICFYEEIGFTLQQIRKLLSTTIYSKEEFLERYLNILELKMERTERLINLASSVISGEKTYDFSAFSKEELLRVNELYKKEIIMRYNNIHGSIL